MTTDERAKEALDHLQQAALEMIAALRAVLDVAEDLVKDPTPVAAFAAGVAHAASQAGGRMTAAEQREQREQREPRVEHIRVS
ncbi:MAG: hypothetical protein H0W70_13085 [Actinobacteria bacterium]|nr:hypothetical protein [Actinomycetota bacterium]